MTSEIEDLSQTVRILGEEANGASSDLQNISLEFGKLTGEGRKFANTFERDLSNAMRNVIVNGASLGDTLKGLALSMADKGIQAAINPMVGMASNAVSSMLPFAQGGVIAGGRVQAFAKGGVVNEPQYFGMNSGVGLMGEAGAEAIMPLARGSDGKLGVRSHNSSSVIVNMRVETPNAESFYRSKSQIQNTLRRALSAKGDE